MTAEEFADRPFAAGVVTGLRSFGYTTDGKLHGVVHRKRWTAGENLAVCDREDDLGLLLWGHSEPSPEHRQATIECTCGFYAYFADSNDYGNGWRGPTITGIVEGYGLVTIGERGFKAEKARIVALVENEAMSRPGCGCRECERVGAPVWSLAPEYADIPLYSTVEAALAAHPTTRPEDVGIEPKEVRRDVVMGGHMYHVHLQLPPSNWSVNVTDVAQRFRDAVRQTGFTLSSAAEALRQFSEPVVDPDPVKRKAEAAQIAAELRARAGLSNLGGINRRRRKL